MKTKALLLASLMLVPCLSWAQASLSGTITRPQQQPSQVDQDPSEPQPVRAPKTSQAREDSQYYGIEMSRKPEDMYNMEGMDAYEVITWTDANGVKHFTDDPRKAPANARRRNIYSVPPSSQANGYRYTQDDVLYIYED